VYHRKRGTESARWKDTLILYSSFAATKALIPTALPRVMSIGHRVRKEQHRGIVSHQVREANQRGVGVLRPRDPARPSADRGHGLLRHLVVFEADHRQAAAA